MPTKEELDNYFNSNPREHTPYSASVYFNIDISDVYKILNGEKDGNKS